jgi:ABC-type nitrate/sulfonate/bicarbonate transport system substrate-binding protein
VQRFAQVIEQANAYSNAHHDETAPILAQYAHIDPAVILKMNRLTNATTLDPGEIQPVIDTVARYKIIDKPFSAKELLL